MAEDQAESAAAETTGTQDQQTNGDATSAETKTTEPAAPPESPIQTIPMARFREVNERMKAAERDKKDLERKLEELTTTQTKTETQTDDRDPTTNMSRDQAIDYQVRQSMERQLGMSLEDAKTILESAPETSRTAQWQQWTDLCGKHQVDPNSKEVQAVVMGLTQSGLKPEEAVKRTAELLKPPSRSASEEFTDPHSVETETLTAEMTRSDWVPRDKREAAAAAARGHRVPHMSVEEIFRRSDKQRGGNTRR